MPALLNWLLRLLPTNPICIRVVQGGSRRTRQLMIRGAFLGVLILLMLMLLMTNFTASSMSLRSLATTGAMIFSFISILQILLVCLLTPVFMSGAIAHEANPRTWEILLSTPLNSLQIVLGNLFGRFFFVMALLVSSLPLFMVLRFFGGVPGQSIIGAFLIAAFCALLVASIAVTLSVTRSGGRRAVFIFYVSIILFLFATYALDLIMRTPIPGGDGATWTTFMTPLNPFLALEVLLASNSYVPQDGDDVNWITRLWLARPVATFCWLCGLTSAALIFFSTFCVRFFARNGQQDSIVRRIVGMPPASAMERDPRPVSTNAVAWREAHRDTGNLVGLLARWMFVALALAAMVLLLWLHHNGVLSLNVLQTSIAFLVLAEVCIVTLTALNLSATAVSREREDGSLDIMLTTPIQPGPYLAGKHLGLIRYLLPLILVPIGSLVLAMIYVLASGFDSQITQSMTSISGITVEVPFLLWQGVVAFALMFIPFIAFCVMIGLLWSIRSRGTIGSVVTAVVIVGLLVSLLSFCVTPLTSSSTFLGPIIASISPVNLLLISLDPVNWMPGYLDLRPMTVTWLMLLGGVLSGLAYSVLAIMLHRNMARTFMMTVRQLAGH